MRARFLVNGLIVRLDSQFTYFCGFKGIYNGKFLRINVKALKDC